MKNQAPLLLLLISFPVFIFSQQGPGGVGATDGTGTLRYWIDANRGFVSTPTISWSDQSGKGVINTVSGNPVLSAAFLNNQNFVTFNRNDGTDLVMSNATINSVTYPQLDVYSVYYTDGTTSTGGIWGEDNGNWDRFIFNEANIGCGSSVSDGSWCTPVAGMFPANTAIINRVRYKEDDPGGSNIQLNGSTVFTFTANNGPQTSGNFAIATIDIGGYALNGKIAEVIVFGSNRNNAEEIIINNYLSAKYNIALAANDVYRQDDPANMEQRRRQILQISLRAFRPDSIASGEPVNLILPEVQSMLELLICNGILRVFHL